MKKSLLVVLLAIFCASGSAWAQSQGPEAGGHEIEVWTGGGHSVSGGTRDTSVLNLGFRYGWVLTNPLLPGPLKGRFEYAVDAVPAFLVFQPGNTAFGAGINPVNFKWNFATTGKVAPYLELSGGTLFTSQNVPLATSKINFTSGAALGTHILRDKWNWSVELRYMHISNAGLTVPNPGVNTVQVRVGLGKFWK